MKLHLIKHFHFQPCNIWCLFWKTCLHSTMAHTFLWCQDCLDDHICQRSPPPTSQHGSVLPCPSPSSLPVCLEAHASSVPAPRCSIPTPGMKQYWMKYMHLLASNSIIIYIGVQILYVHAT